MHTENFFDWLISLDNGLFFALLHFLLSVLIDILISVDVCSDFLAIH